MPQVTDLTAVTTLDGDEPLLIIDDPAVTHVARKITALNLAYYLSAVAVNAQTGSYTLVLTDQFKAVEVTSGSSNNVTVPPNSSVAFPVGTVIEVSQLGAGTTTIVAGGGVTLQSRGSLLNLGGQYASASLRKRGTDTWLVVGDLA